MASSILGKDIQTDNPVALEQDTRLRGMYVIGKPGSGKTTFLVNLVLQDIEQGMGICFLDPHGDAIADIISRIPARREHDVILLDPFDKAYAFGLNLYQCDNPFDIESFSYTVDYVLQVFAKLFADGDLSQMPTMAQVLRTTAITLIENPGMTMAEIPLLLNHEDARARLTSQLKNRQAVNFWKTYDRWKTEKQDEKTSSTLNKLDEFLSLPVIQQIVGQSLSTIDFRDIMDSGKILLVKLPARLEQVSNLLGSIIIGQLLNTAYSRADTPSYLRKQFCIYADEYQRFATPDFATLLVEARKFGIATTIAHQFRNQLDTENKGATLNAATLVIFAVSHIDAEEIAGQFDITPQEAWEEEIEKEWVEVLAEEWEEEIEKEWHERVEEVVDDGIEEIKTPVSNPFDWLVIHSHTNPAVSRFVDSHLRNIHTAFSDEYSRSFRAEFNSILYQAMTNANPLAFICDLHFLRFLLHLNDGYPYLYYFGQTLVSLPDVVTTTLSYEKSYSPHYPQEGAYGHGKGYNSWLVPEYIKDIPTLRVMSSYKDGALDEPLTKALVGMIQAVGESGYKQASEAYALLAEKKFRKRIAAYLAAYDQVYKWHHRAIDIFFTHLYLPPDQEAEKWNKEFQHWMTEERAQFESFIREFRDCILALAQEPITSGSGQYQQRKRTQVTYLTHPRKTITHPRQTLTHPRKTILHPQRTYADVKSELANQLRGLPKYTARVKRESSEEHTIAIEDTDHFIRRADTPITIRDRQQTILSQTRLTYCKPRTEVEQEIAARQDELTRPIQRKQTVQTEERETVSPGTSSLTLDQRKKLSALRKALGDEEYYRFYNDPLVQQQDTLKRLLDSPKLTAAYIKKRLDDLREAGSPADISPFAELIKDLLG